MNTCKKLIIITFIGTLLVLQSSCRKEDDNAPTTVTDIDGNVYNIITIGDQVWMAENLKVSHYRNGDSIPNIKDDTLWINSLSGAYCNYNNNAAYNTIFGKLYNWYTLADSRNIAPKGWHLPSDEEWAILIDFLGGEAVAGDKLKEADINLWIDESSTNESGFTALPGGSRDDSGIFEDAGDAGYWWTTNEHSSSDAFGRGMYYFYSGVAKGYRNKNVGFSVRCIKD